MIEDLQKLGLTKGESKVYLALLKLGTSKVGAIVKNSSVSYSKVYDILDRLTKKGLVSTTLIKNVKHFRSLEPFRLKELLEKKEQEINEQKTHLSKILINLEQLAGEHEQSRSEVFLGTAGLRSASEILLNCEDKTLRFFFPKPSEQASTFYKRMYPKFKEKGISLRGIGNKKFKPKKLTLPKNVKIKFVDFPVPGTIDIIGDKTLIISWDDTITAVLIHSKEVANQFIDYFDNIWNSTK
jgi:sugar-specific transcriptional regulator TrmB